MKITLEYSLKLNPKLNPDLFMPDPKIVLEEISKPPISEWLKFIADEYNIQKIKNLILIPCSFYKPYDPPHDEFYRRINELRKKVKYTKFITVSVPLALEPEEYWSFEWRGYNLTYDCPFFPWIENFGYKWDEEIEKRVFSRLEEVIKGFFERNGNRFEKSIAFFIPNSLELKLVERYVDDFVLSEDPKIEVSYDNNTSEVYCHPKVWRKFEEFLRGNGVC
jgi:predicted RNA-binding protein